MTDALGARMKDQYEDRTRYFLPRRTFTILRLDGKAFHSYTRNLKRPFDVDLIEDMQRMTQRLCEEIQGCCLAYTQSDETSLILTDFSTITTNAWFDGNVQKMASIAASIATAHFNAYRSVRHLGSDGLEIPTKPAYFDARAFTIPDRTEVLNYLRWRQADATRNAIQMVAQSLYSHKELHKKGWSELNELIFQKGINFNDYPTNQKRGSLIVKNARKGTYTNKKTNEEVQVERHFWDVVETPIFTSDEGTAQLENLIPSYS